MKRLINALRFMTIIPLPGTGYSDLSEAGKASALFPVVGLIIGIILSLGAWASGLVWPEAVTAAVVTVLWIILTAGLHVDGLADLADGIGGGWDTESRLRIMKDSNIGTYGALAVVFLIIMKTVLIYAVAVISISPFLYQTLIFIPVAGRCSQVVSIRIFPSARKEGFGVAFKNAVRTTDVCIAVIITVATGSAFWGWYGLVLTAAVTVFMFIAGKWIGRRLGGLTGDCYGALCELSELFLLIIISITGPAASGWLAVLVGMINV